MPKYHKITVQKKYIQKKGNYYLEETIGEGAFAKVKLGIHIPTGEKVAIKILNKDNLFDSSSELCDIHKIRKEINILKRIHHKNVIQLYEIMESKSHLYIVMEYCENKELFDYIISKKYLQEKEACRFFQQIIDGVEYLHLSNITHRDLKPENLLLDKNNRIKISDFGLSCLSENIDTLLETPCGTPSYAPPEMLRGDKYNGVYSDIWSCGIILYTMLVGNLPCAESKEELIYENIMKHNYYFPDNISSEAIDLIENMLKINPKERFDFEQIKAHPWFNKIKPKLKPGIVYGIHKIPIDNNILDCVEKYGYDKEKCRKSILNYNFDENCSIYYLTLKQMIREKKESISDLFSDEYINYLKDYNNWIKTEEINNPLFMNYRAKMPFEIEQEKAKNFINNALLEYNNNSLKYPLSEKNGKKTRIFDNEIHNNKKVENSEKIKTTINDNLVKKLELNTLTLKVDKKVKKGKIRKNVSCREIPKYNNNKIQDIINKRVLNKKTSIRDNLAIKTNYNFNILTKRNNEKHLNRKDFNCNNEIKAKNNFINKSAKNRKKHILLDLEEKRNNKSQNDRKIKKAIKYEKTTKKQNDIKNKSIIKNDSSSKFIDISKIEISNKEIQKSYKDLLNNLDKTNISDSISLSSKIVLSPKTFSLSNENNSNNISETSKKIEFSYNNPKKNFKINSKENENLNISICDKLKEEEKIKLRKKLENDEIKFKNDLNILNNITSHTTMDSININNSFENKNKNNDKNLNLLHLMAKKLLKNSIFGKHLLKNKKKKKIIKNDLENKFYTLQKYKDIIGLIENIKNKIFKKKYTDFNYQTFDEYLNDEDDKIFSSSLLKIIGIKRFIKKAKISLYQKEKLKKRAFSKAYNMNSFKFNKIFEQNPIRKRYITEHKNFENFIPKRNIGYYNPRKKLNLSYLTSEENNVKTNKKNYNKKKLNSSRTSNNESIINSNINRKKFFGSENTKNKNFRINLKVYRYNDKFNKIINNKKIKKTKEIKPRVRSQNINKTLESNSDISINNNSNIINKNKTNISSDSSIIKCNNEDDESFISNINYYSKISNKNISIKNETDEENDIYKQNKNIITPQLGTKINNNIFTQNSPNKYDSDEGEQFIIDSIPLIVNIENDNNKNKKKEIEVKDNDKLRNEVWKLSDKKIKLLNNENISRNDNQLTTLNNKRDLDISMNKTNVTFCDKNKSKKYVNIKDNVPIDLNCIISLPFNEIKSKIKSYFKKLGYFYTEKENIIKIKRGNTNEEISIYKFNGNNNVFYLSIKIKTQETGKEKENIKKLLKILNHSKI